MGTEVTFEAVRKSDFVPYASFFLGGNGTAKAIGESNKSTLTIDEIEIVSLDDWKEAIDYLIALEDSFYLGHYGEKAIELIEVWQDRMAYFLRIN